MGRHADRLRDIDSAACQCATTMRLTMKRHRLPFLVFLLLPLVCLAQTEAIDIRKNEQAASVASLKALITKTETDPALPPDQRSKLLELYNKSLENLSAIDGHKQATAEYHATQESVTVRLKELQADLDRRRPQDPLASLQSLKAASLETLDRLLQQERATLAAAEARLAENKERLAYDTGRPAEIRSRLIALKQDIDGMAAKIQAEKPAQAENVAISQARRWLLETRALALIAERDRLEQELISQPARDDLNKLQRQLGQIDVDQAQARVDYLQNLVVAGRQAEAKELKKQAQATIRTTEGKHPLLHSYAEKNARLGEGLIELASGLDKLRQSEDEVKALAKSINEDAKAAKQKLEIAGMSQALGRVLQEQRRRLPELRNYERDAKRIEERLAEIGLDKVQHEEELEELSAIDSYLARYIAGKAPGISAEEKMEIQGRLADLARERAGILEKVITAESAIQRALGDLEFAQRDLLRITREYDQFLDKHLLWIPSAPPVNVGGIAAVWPQILELLEPGHWLDLVEILTHRFVSYPPFPLALLLIGILAWMEPRHRRAIRDSAQYVGKASRDRISSTARALVLTLALALTWPLLLFTLAWQLQASEQTNLFTRSVATALAYVGIGLFYLRAFRVLCMPGGVAERHFKWSETGLRRLRRDIDILIYTWLPPLFIGIIVIINDTESHGAGLGRLMFVLAMVALAAFAYRVLLPGSGALHGILAVTGKRTSTSLRYLWLLIAVALPVAAALLSVFGYMFTAGVLIGGLIESLWLILVLVVLQQFIIRWLLLVRRRLTLQAVLARRQAEREKSETEPVSVAGTGRDEDLFDITQPEVDLAAVSEDSRSLVNLAITILAVLGFWYIWSEVLPAFTILEEVTLWEHKTTVDGVDKFLPVTLADVILSVLILVVLITAVRRLPSLLEIALLQRLEMTGGGRYAVKTLTNYALIAVGIVVIFNVLGGTWSEIQWIFAALGVGIGFGLQEIVANFISGLIILFERPVRVGDVVTIGDTSGVVTRIQIRATTIRNWDRQELLVPNKEFITGRLLNWSLSDETNRVTIPVGVAYGSDVQLAMQLMEEAARESPLVLDDPAPFVIFESFGDNALTLRLRAYIPNVEHRLETVSRLHQAINDKFIAAGLVIAFPQRDVHLDTAKPLDIRLWRGRRGGNDDGVTEGA